MNELVTHVAEMSMVDLLSGVMGAVVVIGVASLIPYLVVLWWVRKARRKFETEMMKQTIDSIRGW